MTADRVPGQAPAPRAAAEAIAVASKRLAAAGVASARLDAELLMAEAAGASRAAVVANAVKIDAGVLERFERMVGRRALREPLAYITGRREFFSLELAVHPGVLIPRPETETVVEAALEFLRAHPAANVVDLGTGSGAIAIAIAANAPEARIVAVDISEVSLEIASANAVRHRCARRIVFHRMDFFAALESYRTPFDLIVSNPPYIARSDIAALEPDVRDFEPRVALEGGGTDGMDFYRKIAARLARWLAPDGEAILEVGAGQADAVAAIMLEAGCTAVERLGDLAGIDRVVRVRRAA